VEEYKNSLEGQGQLEQESDFIICMS